MIHYVMVISIMLTPVGPSDWKYIGHFVNCTQAHQHMKLHYPEATGSRCLLEEYIHLPDEIEHKYHI